jgi:hypothetical protein
VRITGLVGALAVGALMFGLIGGSKDASAAPVDIIENGGFEAGTPFDGWTAESQPGSSGAWCPQTGTAAPGITSNKGGVACGGPDGSGATVASPPEGASAAMTDQSGPSSNVLFQCVDIPADATSAELSFQLYLNNDDDDFHPHATLDYDLGVLPKGAGSGREYIVLGGNGDPNANQQFRADIVDPAVLEADRFTVTVLENVYQTLAGDPTESGYDLITADLSAYIGQSICIRFAEVDNQTFFNAGVDDVELIVDQPDEPTPGVTAEPLSPPPTADQGPISAPDTGSGSNSGTSPMLYLAISALVVAITGAGALAYARRR